MKPVPSSEYRVLPSILFEFSKRLPTYLLAGRTIELGRPGEIDERRRRRDFDQRRRWLDSISSSAIRSQRVDRLFFQVIFVFVFIRFGFRANLGRPGTRPTEFYRVFFLLS